jgi:hypothetical protein
MNDKELTKMLKTMDVQTAPPEGLKERLLCKVMGAGYHADPFLTPLEKFFFEKPLRAACCVSILLSGVLWAALGSGFAVLINGILG